MRILFLSLAFLANTLLFSVHSKAQCANNVTYTATPGPYSNGQIVTVCVNVGSYTQTGTNWIHGYVFDIGSAFDPNSIVITQYPEGADGTWGLYTSVTSNSTGQTNGPGVFYDTGGDNNPGNNYGYSCNGCSSTLCFEITVSDATGTLSLLVDVTGDGETGGWTSGFGDCGDEFIPGIEVIGGVAPCTFSLSSTVVDPICDASNGSVDLTVSNGTGPFVFNWDGNGVQYNTEDISDLSEGSYSVTATDATGCSSTHTANLAADFSTAPTVTISSTNPFCDNTNGSLTAQATGTGPFEYAWSVFGNTETVSDLGVGFYSVTVYDAYGCKGVADAELVITETATISATAVNNSCSYSCDGSASASATGTAPYFYAWSNFTLDTTSASSMATGFCPGDYSVTVIDAHQCTATTTVSIVSPPAIALNFTSVPTLCYGDQNGSATVTVQNATAPLSYLWSQGDTVDVIDNLPAGSYSVTVVDAIGCTATSSVIVDQPLSMLMGFDAHDALCHSDSSGWVESAVVQGTPPYSYLWSEGSATQTLIGVPAGTYGLTITDASGCTVDSTVSLSQPEPMEVLFGSVPASCQVANNGVDSAFASGGTPGYNYVWNTFPQTIGFVAENLSPGTYTVTVTDANNCVLIDSSVIIGLPLFPVYASDDLEVVRGYATSVSVSLDTIGFFNYEWTPSITVTDIFGSTTIVMPDSTTTYTVMVTDVVTGCQNSDTVVVTVTPNPYVHVPNAFSPNGDGVNDLFFPIPGDGVTMKSFNVFDRWGERIFNADWFPGWDGRNKGKQSPLGVYTYYCEFTIPDGTSKVKSGTVTLMR